MSLVMLQGPHFFIVCVHNLVSEQSTVDAQYEQATLL